MKTYKTHSGCKRNQGAAYPVGRGDATLWTADFNIGDVVEEAVFAVRSLPDTQFDRIFRLRRLPNGSLCVECEMSRGFPSQWPGIDLFNSDTDARSAFNAIVTQYRASDKWTQRD